MTIGMTSLRYVRGFIDEVVTHGPGLKSLVINIDKLPVTVPGQFIMLWVPGYEEIPLSPSYHANGVIRLTIRERGPTTRKIHSMDVGEPVFLRGPYGTGFDLSRRARYLLVGGGYGAAPIIFAGHVLHKKGFESMYIEGVKSREYGLYTEEAGKLGMESMLVTEDGSSGYKGLVTEYVEKNIDGYDIVLGCGPEPMLNRLIEICLEHGVECQVSMERYIKCGVGICGSCILEGTGLLVCRDGPVFNARDLLEAGYEVGVDD